MPYGLKRAYTRYIAELGDGAALDVRDWLLLCLIWCGGGLGLCRTGRARLRSGRVRTTVWWAHWLHSKKISYRRVGGRQADQAARSQRRARHSPGPGVPIIADIVMTITLDPTLTSAAALGVIVLVGKISQAFLLQVELEGSLPWRRRAGPDSQGSPDSD